MRCGDFSCEKYTTTVKIGLIGKYIKNENGTVFIDAYGRLYWKTKF
jgi:hypothetical protein